MVARPPPVPVTVLVGVCDVYVELKLKLLGPSGVSEASLPGDTPCLP
jgi:hypothetical protein